jgi:hypothetical protein
MAETSETEWVLPIRPVRTPPDVEAALARAEYDQFLARHAPDGRRMPSIFSGRDSDEARGR